jgi:SpoVK/Ycf46/Vps4 family AAA+-type ATPase
VPPPDATARQAILDIHLRGVPAQGLDLAKIVKVTDKFSGADLKALISRAAEQAIIAEMRTGKSTEVTQRMLRDALTGMRPSTEEWLETARNYASYSNRAGIYDDLVAYFEGR